MIYGIGTDICDIRRIERSLIRYGGHFAAKLLMPSEWAIWHERHARAPERGVQFVATRFSAKEAFSKAIGLGMVTPMGWQRCEVTTLASGQPAIVLHGALKDWFDARHLRAHISMSDEADYATSFCIVEKMP